jgi:hypothetical protein
MGKDENVYRVTESQRWWGKLCRSWMEIRGYIRKLAHFYRAAIRENVSKCGCIDSCACPPERVKPLSQVILFCLRAR